ncbi:clathrin adaptor complex small chain family protein [Cryptosporidium muris RN66]|uniref:AP complex subunit sigma n=1 Tax=Cryptosporidium muris (strain RN66) TaxID=441375 RepID=B6AIL4_CRYMR|nr:clathrin adaptor complex small chain family protein [Cryptosporidium muris RN66]EEA08055.1 clathrin adaptor complex small chain family protein [Cryptosporidium muris RN66]|eukprot:XP_002142404.1 clathrin adaptor complex small chain family protein [Cryptosporidium muris RN66]
MIHFLLLQNIKGRTRFARWYTILTYKERKYLEEEIQIKIANIENQNISYFNIGNKKIVYKRFSNIYIIVGIDNNDNYLFASCLIQLIAEITQKRLQRISEIDIVYQSKRFSAIIDEIVMGGEVIDTSIPNILKRLRYI